MSDRAEPSERCVDARATALTRDDTGRERLLLARQTQRETHSSGSHVTWNAGGRSGVPSGGGAAARHDATTSRRTETGRGAGRGALDRYRTQHVKTQNEHTRTATGRRGARADSCKRSRRGRHIQYGHAEVTLSAMRSTDGSRRTFRGTGHSKIHDSPLCARK